MYYYLDCKAFLLFFIFWLVWHSLTFSSPYFLWLYSWTGKTYRIRVHNVGISTSLNFRIQNHNLLLAESEGSYTVQQNYTSLDIHVGQSYSFLLMTDQNASSDYYIVASARFVNETRWKRVTGVAILHYSNSKGKARGPLPEAPNDEFDKTFSMNQARSIRFVPLVIMKFPNCLFCGPVVFVPYTASMTLWGQDYLFLSTLSLIDSSPIWEKHSNHWVI